MSSNSAPFSTVLLQKPQGSKNKQDKSPKPSTNSSDAISEANQRQIQDSLVDDILGLCKNLKKTSEKMDDELKADSNVLDQMSESVNSNKSQINRVNKDVEEAIKKRRQKNCVSFSTFGLIIMLYFITKIIIKLVPPHPFGLK